MKKSAYAVLVALALAGCRGTATSTDSTDSSSGAGGTMPAGAVVVADNEMTVEYDALEADVVRLLEAGQYDEIERRAQQLRTSKEAWLSGYWHLSALYRALFRVPRGSSEEEWQKRIDLLEAWVGRSPKSVTANVALARAYHEGAWRARGDGFANSITPAMSQTMHEREGKAATVLQSSNALRKQCPGWYAASQRVALLQNWPRDQYDALVDEAIATFPTYDDFHFTRLGYLLPRWHGSAGEMEAYTDKVANEKSGVEGDIRYAKLVWSLLTTGMISNIFEETNLSWPRTRSGFEALLKRHPDSYAVASAYCCLAVRASDRPIAKQLMETKLKNRVDTEVWESQALFEKNRRWLYRS